MRSGARSAAKAAATSDGASAGRSAETFATLRADTSSRFCAAAMPEVAIDRTLVMRPEYRAGAKLPLRDPGQSAGARQGAVRDLCPMRQKATTTKRTRTSGVALWSL